MNLFNKVVLCALVAAQVQIGTPADRAEFVRLDVTGNGYLTGPEITPAVRAYDTNGDNVIDWNEFVAGRARDRGTPPRKTPTTTPPQATQPRSTAPPARPVRLSPLAARPGYVIGRAVFTDGRPVPRFRVTALGFTGELHLGPVGTLPNLGTLVAQNGQYAIRTTSEIDRRPVKALVVGVTGYALIARNGKEFGLELYPTDGKKDGSAEGYFRGDSGRGVVRDFVLLLSGPKRGFERNTPPRDTDTNNMSDPSFGAFYGATVALNLPRDAEALEGATLTATFTPTGPLYDGSTGKVVVRTLVLRKPNLYAAYFRDLPLGDYSLTAQITKQGGVPRALSLRVLGGNLQPSLPLIFEPNGSWGVSPTTVLSE